LGKPNRARDDEALRLLKEAEALLGRREHP
jgi:hypothetical protein